MDAAVAVVAIDPPLGAHRLASTVRVLARGPVLAVELWASIDSAAEWHAIPLAAQGNGLWACAPPFGRTLEYTVRYRAANDDAWMWAGPPGHNARLWRPAPSNEGRATVVRGVALVRKSQHWLEPVFLAPRHVAWAHDRCVYVALQLADGSWAQCAAAPGDVFALEITEDGEARVAPPFTLEHGLALSDLNLFAKRPPPTSPASPLLDYLGFCSWDAMYTDLDHDRLIDHVSKLQRLAKDRFRWVIIDDGWQHVDPRIAPVNTTQRLCSFLADPIKFPGGLGACVDELKDHLGITLVGVWHAAQGYWGGVTKNGMLVPGSAVHWVNEAGLSSWFDAFYAQLQAAGIDFVKMDNISSLEDVDASHPNYIRTHLTAHRAASEKYFDASIPTILCMCNAPAATKHLTDYSRPAILRISDDFYPQQQQAHALHVVTNAMTDMYFGAMLPNMVLDSDMFWLAQPHLARLILPLKLFCGHPVYVSERDPPVKLSLDVICALDARIVRFPERALILAETWCEPEQLFVYAQPSPSAVNGWSFLALNMTPTPRLVCLPDPRTLGIRGRLAVSEALASEDSLVLYSRAHGLLGVWDDTMLRAEVIPWCITAADADVLTCAPLVNGLAVLGCCSTMAPLAAVDSVTHNKGQVVLKLAYMVPEVHVFVEGASLDLVVQYQGNKVAQQRVDVAGKGRLIQVPLEYPPQ